MIEDFPRHHTVGVHDAILSALVSLLSFRVSSRASPELELAACHIGLSS